ncbi:DUF3892 domain-containing protein [Candidatus Uhrbacteria bacterium]|nr:DUF3892 domain-containing protein [Candidatus Uhrbacteria bacterium]
MIQVTCVNKDGGNHFNRHEGITNFGWTDTANGQRGNSGRDQMIAFLEKGGQAFTRDVYNNVAWLVVRMGQARKYVQTVADNKFTDNLLSLNECRI